MSNAATSFLQVPAGTVLLGSRPAVVRAYTRAYGSQYGEAFSRELPHHSVDVPAFLLARTPVTRAHYAAFVDAGGYRDRRWWTPQGWVWRLATDAAAPALCDDPALAGDDLPVAGVTWHEAWAFARWAGGRLPTEAEWERAAKGDDDRFYPWGSRWDATRCIVPSNPARVGHYAPAPVGQCSPAGDGPFGHQDLLGQVWEWCSSHLLPYPYSSAFSPNENFWREDPFDPGPRVLRGGSWSDWRAATRNAYREVYLEECVDARAGFRIARDLEPSPSPGPAPEHELALVATGPWDPGLIAIKRVLVALGVPYRQLHTHGQPETAAILATLGLDPSRPACLIVRPATLTPAESHDSSTGHETLLADPDEKTLRRWLERQRLA